MPGRLMPAPRRRLRVVSGVVMVGAALAMTARATLPDGETDRAIAHAREAVAEFQESSVDTWSRQHGPPLAHRAYFPALTSRGDEIVRAIGSAPDDPDSLIYLTLLSAIAQSMQSPQLTTAYFAPDPQLIETLTDAARRGVEERLVLPSYSDSWTVFDVGHSYYTSLLEAGVMIHERKGAVMHATTACIDGVWSTIGSTNLDWRRFLHNDEINAVVLGRGFGTPMSTMFDIDLRESDAIELERWRERGWLMRMKEQGARLGAYWL